MAGLGEQLSSTSTCEEIPDDSVEDSVIGVGLL